MILISIVHFIGVVGAVVTRFLGVSWPKAKQQEVTFIKHDLSFLDRIRKMIQVLDSEISELKQFSAAVIYTKGKSYKCCNMSLLVVSEKMVEFNFTLDIVESFQVSEIFLLFPDGHAYLGPKTYKTDWIPKGCTLNVSYRVVGDDE